MRLQSTVISNLQIYLYIHIQCRSFERVSEQLLFSASTMYIMTIFYEMMMETCYFKGINGEH